MICPDDCKHMEKAEMMIGINRFCRKYRRRLFTSAGGAVQLPQCLNDQASSRLDQ